MQYVAMKNMSLAQISPRQILISECSSQKMITLLAPENKTHLANGP